MNSKQAKQKIIDEFNNHVKGKNLIKIEMIQMVVKVIG